MLIFRFPPPPDSYCTVPYKTIILLTALNRHNFWETAVEHFHFRNNETEDMFKVILEELDSFPM